VEEGPNEGVVVSEPAEGSGAAVLAVFEKHGFDVFDGGGTDLMITRETGEAILAAVRAWDAAGRPGLPPSGEPCAICGGVGYTEEDHGPHGIERIGCPCEGLPVAQAKLKARHARLLEALRKIEDPDGKWGEFALRGFAIRAIVEDKKS
jgi:hypothetical protein